MADEIVHEVQVQEVEVVVDTTNGDVVPTDPTAGDPNRGQSQQGATVNINNGLPEGRGCGGNEEKEASDDGFGLRKLFRQEDENKWTMNNVLAVHFSAHTRIHIPETDMKTNLEEFPVPSNIDNVLRLDNTFRSLLKKEPRGACVIDMDSDWETVQQKVQDVMGPLGVAWSQCALFKKGDLAELDGFQLAEILELSVLSLAHVVQKINWYRRVHCLSALGPVKNARDTLKEEKVQKIFVEDSSTNLFPKEFDEHLKSMQGTRVNVVKHFKPEEKKKKKETTAAAASK